jgi:hypothetical protein
MATTLAERIAMREYRKTIADDKAIADEVRTSTWKTSNAVGQHVARFSQRFFLAIQEQYRRDKSGGAGNCGLWIHDREYVKAVLRDNPQIRVKSTRGTRGQEILQAVGRPKGKVYA